MAGLDSQLDGVKGRILAIKPLPNIQSVYVVVCAEANQQGAMLGGTIGEGVAMATKKTSSSKKDRKCTYCNGTGHTMDTCFRLHGYPDWHPKSKKVSQVSSNNQEEDTNPKANLAKTSGFAAQSGTSLTSNSEWIVDSGATDHMTCDRFKFNQLSSNCSMSTVTNANGVSSPIVGTGTIPLSPSLNIKNVLFVQNLHTKEKIGSGRERGGLYYLEDDFQFFRKGQAHLVQEDSVDKKKAQIWLWHKRLGHPSFFYLKRLFPSLFVGFNVLDFACKTCTLAKNHRAIFPLSENKTNIHFSLVHSDVWGPAPISTLNGMRWYVIFVDDCTRMTWVYLLKKKSDVSSVIRLFHQMILTQFGMSIKVLRLDNEGEYLNQELTDFMGSVGMIHHKTCPYSPQ